MTQCEDHVQLQIGVKCEDGFPLVMLEGECDGFTAPFTHGAVRALIDEGYRGIIVDISRLEFLDVAGFHALDDCCIRISERKGLLLLVNPSEKVKEIYDILRERESCKMVKTIDEAMSKLKSALP